MSYLRHIVLGMLSVLIGSSAAVACEPMRPPAIWIDKKVKVLADCSFTQAENRFDEALLGAPAVDIGGGKVGQKVEAWAICTKHERLIVVDCQAGEGMFIEGTVDPKNSGDLGGGPARLISMIQPPHGPIHLTGDSTIPALAAIAKSAGLDYTTNLAKELGQMEKRNRFNPFCGCRIFYPKSAGATK